MPSGRASDKLTRDVTALILAGGAGRRSGGRDKGLLPWQGKPLVDRVIHRLRPQVAKILISCNRNTGNYARRAPVVTDLRPGFAGPLAGMEAASGRVDTDWLLVSPCDTPNLPDDLCRRLMSALSEPEGERSLAGYAVDADGAHYLCALLRREALASLPKFLDSGARAVHHWYAEIGALPVSFPDSEHAFLNLNENF